MPSVKNPVSEPLRGSRRLSQRKTKRTSSQGVEVISFGKFGVGISTRVTKTLLAALCYLKEKNVYLEVSIVDRKTIRDLNLKFRKVDKDATVLSFSEPADPFPSQTGRYLGEILLSPDVIKSKGENIEFYAVHGLLHLLGYTHDGKSDNMEMEKLETELIEVLKLRR